MSSTALDARKVEQRRVAGESDATTTAARDSVGSSGQPAPEDDKKLATIKAGGSRRNVKPQPKKKDSEFKLIHLIPLVFIGLAYLAMKIPINGTKPAFNWNATEYVYAFGDSYTFIEGTAGHADHSFIGDASHISFKPEELLSNRIVPRKTSSGGSNWIEFLTGCFEGRPSDCVPHQLWDFAFAGAVIDSKHLPSHNDFSVDLVQQVKQWGTHAAKVIPHPQEKTLTTWWVGNTDTRDVADNATITDWTLFWHAQMQSYFNAVEYAYGRGLRGTYLFINVPPGQRTGEELIGQRVKEFNNILSGYIQGVAARLPKINVLSFDAYKWFNEVLDNPGQYGFTDTTTFCECTDPAFFWYNNGHITERAHKLLADAIEAKLLVASS